MSGQLNPEQAKLADAILRYYADGDTLVSPELVALGKKIVAGTASVAELEEFLDGISSTWHHVGGYAMYKWLVHYGITPVPAHDLDIALDADQLRAVRKVLFNSEEPPSALPTIEGMDLSLQPATDVVLRYRVGNSWLVSPEVLARNYGTSAAQPSFMTLLQRGATAEGGSAGFNLRKVGPPGTTTKSAGDDREKGAVDDREKGATVESADDRERREKAERRAARVDKMAELLRHFKENPPH